MLTAYYVALIRRSFVADDLRSDTGVPPPGVAVFYRGGVVGTVLAVAIGSLLLSGAAVAVLTVGLGHDHLMGLAGLLDLNGEHNLPTWFSSAMLIATAASLAVASQGAPAHLRRCWATLAAVFVLLSLDEMASLHEMSNAPLRSLLAAGPIVYFPWIGLGLTFAAAVAWSQRVLLFELPPSTRWLFVSAGALYVFGAVGMEALAAPIYAASGKASGAHAVLVTIEEALEMSGVAVFFLAVWHHATSAHPPVVIAFDDRVRVRPAGTLHLSPRQVALALGTVVMALAVVSLSAQAVHYLTAADLPATVRLVNLSREGNIPTWYQAAALLACAAGAAAIAAAAWRDAHPFRWHWVAVALAFVYLSADEAAGIHELSVRPLRSALGASGLLYYPWILVGSAVVVVAAVASRTFIAGLPSPTRGALLTGPRCSSSVRSELKPSAACLPRRTGATTSATG